MSGSVVNSSCQKSSQADPEVLSTTSSRTPEVVSIPSRVAIVCVHGVPLPAPTKFVAEGWPSTVCRSQIRSTVSTLTEVT